jgi:hypothetical protein
MRIPLGWLVLFFFSSTGFATFLPPNDLYKQDRIMGFDQTTMTEVEFNQVIDRVYEAMEPSVRLHGGTLDVSRLWKDSTVNAKSTQLFGRWQVLMYGGLARRPEMNQDGFTLVMCHEMGHHLGGFPFIGNFIGRWAASEGQADYFATQVCARKVWGDAKAENAKSRFDVAPAVKAKCDQTWATQDEQNLCYRISGGARALAMLLNTLKKGSNPDFSTPDTSVVTKTNTSYPSVQCRLDTYFNGSLCDTQFDLTIIPGRTTLGFENGTAGEEAASKYSCFKTANSSVGIRPACWFKQSI